MASDASPAMTCVQDIHVGQSSCVLCRQTPSAGSYILDLSQNLLVVPGCGNPCAYCSHSPYPLVWLHATCYNILENSYEPSKKPTFEDLGRFANATRPAYKSQYEGRGEIASVLEGLLSKYTRNIFQDSFRQALLRQLPVEIMTMISKLIAPCWYLIVLGETRRLIELSKNDRETQCTRLSLTGEIWMSRIYYRGISYVARLSNKPLESTSTSDQYHMKLPSNISKMVVSVDSIGLRGIQFMDHNSNPMSDGSPWYEIFEAGDSHLEAHVLFVRGIQLVSDDSSSMCRIWSSPFLPRFHPWNFYHARVKPRLHYVKFDAHIQGLLVCCANAKIVGIHSFSDMSTAFREFVDLMHQRASKSYKHWFYFPFNGHEYIKAAWIRKFKNRRGPASNPILVVSPSFLVLLQWLTGKLQTSLGRNITFGPQFPARIIGQYEYHSLVKHGDGAISGIFHDGLDPGSKYISEVGVTCSDQNHAGTLEPLPIDTHFEPPAVPPGRGSIASTWYMTEAPLKGLIKVQVCRDQEQSHHPCLGLLLFYNDQHTESLGQVRWDHDLTQEILEPIYIENGTIDGRDYIKDIRNDIHDLEFNAETGGWQKLPKCGIIVWWFGQLGDRIITYND